MTNTPSEQARELLAAEVAPWADFHGDLPDYDHPLRCVFESGVQYAVELLAKELGVKDWEACDGTEEYDGDLGGTLVNIVKLSLPQDQHGDHMIPREVCELFAASPSSIRDDVDLPRLGANMRRPSKPEGQGAPASPSGHEPSASASLRESSQSRVPSAVRLTELEKLALAALEEGRDAYAPFGHSCYSFNSIAHDSGVPRHSVRRVVRSLARKGLAEFHKGLWSEDGEPRGAGYGLSQAGCEWIDEARKEGCYAHVRDRDYGYDFCIYCSAPLGRPEQSR